MFRGYFIRDTPIAMADDLNLETLDEATAHSRILQPQIADFSGIWRRDVPLLCGKGPPGAPKHTPPSARISIRNLWSGRVASYIVFSLLLGLALPAQTSAKDTGYVFVSNEKMHSVAVIDPKQDYRVIKWIETSHGPRDMKFRDNRKQLLVVCGDDDVIDVIDVATLAVTDHIPTGHDPGPAPEMFELSRDETTLYVSNQEASAVQEIGVDKIIGREIQTGAGPGAVAVSSDGKALYVTSEISDWVHVADVEAAVVTDNIVVGTRPKRFLLMPGGKELWVSVELSGQVSIIDRVTNQISANLNFLPPGFREGDVTPVGMTMNKDGKTAFVALGRANYVAFVDTATREIRDYVLVGSHPWGVALSANEKTLYVVNWVSDDLSIVDVPSRKAIKAVPVGRGPHSVQVDDDDVGSAKGLGFAM
jgi:PQQ-dependent catabolism-associated beta-propeller protein